MPYKNKFCVYCDQEFIPLSPVTKSCSPVCKQIIINQQRKKRYISRKKNKICSECQKEFSPSNNIQKVCNKECASKRETRIKRERRNIDPKIRERCALYRVGK